MGVFTVALLIGFMTLGTSVSLSDPLSPPPWRNGHVTSTLPTSQGSAIIQSLQCPLPLSIGQPEGRLSLIPFPMLCPRAFSLFSPSSSRRDISEPLPTSPCQLLLPTPSLVRRGWRCQFVLMVLRVSGRDSVTPTGRCKNRLSPTAAPPRHSVILQAASVALVHLFKGGAGDTAQLTSVERRACTLQRCPTLLLEGSGIGPGWLEKWPLDAGSWRMAWG